MSPLSRMLCSLRRGRGTLQSALHQMINFPDYKKNSSQVTTSLPRMLCSWWTRASIKFVNWVEQPTPEEKKELDLMRYRMQAAMGPYYFASRLFLLDVVHRKFVYDHQNLFGRLRREARLAGRPLHKSGAVVECCKILMADIEQKAQQDLVPCDMATVQQILAEHNEEWKFLHVMRSLNEACAVDAEGLFDIRPYRTSLERLAESINTMEAYDLGILDNKGIYKDSYCILFKSIIGRTVEDVVRDTEAGTLDKSYKYFTNRTEFLEDLNRKR